MLFAIASVAKLSDAFQSSRWIFEHFVVRNSDSPNAESAQNLVSPDIGSSLEHVNFTVDLHREAQFRAVEVDDKAANHMLASKLQTSELTPAQQLSNDSFRVSRVFAQVMRK